MSVDALLWAIDQDAGSGGAKSLLMAIANFCQTKHGELGWVSQEAIGKKSNNSPETMRRLIPRLEELNLVRRIPLKVAGRKTIDLFVLPISPHFDEDLATLQSRLPPHLEIDGAPAKRGSTPTERGSVEPPQNAGARRHSEGIRPRDVTASADVSAQGRTSAPSPDSTGISAPLPAADDGVREPPHNVGAHPHPLPQFAADAPPKRGTNLDSEPKNRNLSHSQSLDPPRAREAPGKGSERKSFDQLFAELVEACRLAPHADPTEPARKEFRALIDAGEDGEGIVAARRRYAEVERSTLGTKWQAQLRKWLAERHFVDYLPGGVKNRGGGLRAQPIVGTPAPEDPRMVRVKDRLRGAVGADVFESWLRLLRFGGIADGTVRLTVASQVARARIDSDYRPHVLRAWTAEDPSITRVIIEYSAGAATAPVENSAPGGASSEVSATAEESPSGVTASVPESAAPPPTEAQIVGIAERIVSKVNGGRRQAKSMVKRWLTRTDLASLNEIVGDALGVKQSAAHTIRAIERQVQARPKQAALMLGPTGKVEGDGPAETQRLADSSETSKQPKRSAR